MRRRGKYGLRTAIVIAVFAMIAVACGGDGEPTGTGTGDGGEQAGGQTITMLHGIKGENEQAALQAMIDAYEAQSENTVKVEASPDFETVIVTRVQGGNPPDVALFPQPGLLQRIATQGNVRTLQEAGVDLQGLKDALVPGMVEAGTFEGDTYGTVVKLNIKSLLWYPKDDFEAAGYQVPESWQAMLDLTDTIASDLTEAGRAPWCIGIESGGATGWVATDWIEDIVLRMHGPEVYDKWVNHEIKFNSPEITAAFEEMAKIWMNEDYVLGGTTGILQTPFAESVAPLFSDPPGCFLHRQAGFITSSFPEDATIGEDVAMTYFPAMEQNGVGDQPVLFAGDTAAVLSENKAAADFLEFMVSSEGQTAWMSHEGAGALSVRSDFDSSKYPTDVLAQQGDILANAGFARFDASDLMPGEVGAGTFWSEIVAWISGGQDLETTLTNIDNSWPEGN